MSQGFQQQTFAAGQRIFEAGQPAEELYIVQSGTVRIVDGLTGATIAQVVPGEAFGEQAMLPGGLRIAAAEAVGEVSCLRIDSDSLRTLLKGEAPVMTVVFEALLLQLSMHNALRHRR